MLVLNIQVGFNMTLYQEIKDASNKKLYLTNEEIEALYKEDNANITYRYKEVL